MTKFMQLPAGNGKVKHAIYINENDKIYEGALKYLAREAVALNLKRGTFRLKTLGRACESRQLDARSYSGKRVEGVGGGYVMCDARSVSTALQQWHRIDEPDVIDT